MRVTVKAAAKINLMLDIVGRLENGYHNLWMVMQSVDLYDTVAVERTGAGGEIRLTCSDDRLPTDETNLAFKAARTFFEATKAANDGISITINKAIPFAPGLPEAARMPRQRFWRWIVYGTRLKMRTLNKIGLTLGADVPFCLQGGTMLAQHIGELLTPVPELPDCFIVLAKPRRGFLPRRRIIYAIPRRICARRIGLVCWAPAVRGFRKHWQAGRECL